VIDDDVLHQRQPQPRPALLGREERIEDLGHIRGANAGPRVVNRYDDAARRLAHRDVQPPLRRARHRLARIADQVQERLPQLALIGADIR